MGWIDWGGGGGVIGVEGSSVEGEERGGCLVFFTFYLLLCIWVGEGWVVTNFIPANQTNRR